MTDEADDELTIAELREKAAWYDDHGWTKNAERIRDTISELEESGEDSVEATVYDGESDGDADFGELEEQLDYLHERLQWYEERGWSDAAEEVRQEIAEHKEDYPGDDDD